MSAKSVQEITQPENRVEKLERFCQLNLWKQSVQNRLDEEDRLKKEIRSWYLDKPADQPITVPTASGQVILSAKKNEREITYSGMVFVYKYLVALKNVGLKGFLELCRQYLPLSVLDQHIPEEKRSSMITTSLTGSRTVKAVAKSPLAA